MFTSSEVASDSTLDTASLGSPTSCDSVEWPDPFVIPAFPHDVEFQLRAANDAYAKDGTVIVISKGVKSEILDKLADIISKITAYPDKDHYESIAKALVAKHPCLREPGSGKGWYCWVFSLRFKMGSYRQRMMSAGCPEVLENKRKRGEGCCKPVKKSKKGEIHYLPEPPDGQTAVKSEKDRETMLLEVQKRDPDLQLLDELMIATLSWRRQEIIGDEPFISAVMDRWPALFCQRQVILCQLSTAYNSCILLCVVKNSRGSEIYSSTLFSYNLLGTIYRYLYFTGVFLFYTVVYFHSSTSYGKYFTFYCTTFV